MQEYEYEKEEEGITLGELFKVIFKRVWILVAVTLAVAVIAIVAVALFINVNKKEYRLDYTLEFPGYENLRYPDGTAFRQQDLISLQTLNAIKTADEDFASIDTEKMAEQNDITIVSETTDSSGTRRTSGKYTITVKASYFSSEETATAFLKKIASIPVDYIQAVTENANYDFNLTAYGAVGIYETKIDYLAAQREYLKDKYSELIEKYGESYRYEGRSISDYAYAAALQFTDTAESDLRTDLELHGYVFDEETYQKTAELKIAALNKEKTENEALIAALNVRAAENDGLLAGNEAFAEEIVALATRNIKIDTELVTIQRTLDNLGEQDSTKFDEFLMGYYNSLKSATDTYHNVIQFIYEKETEVTFGTSKAVMQGGTNLIVAAVGGLVGGFVIACVIVCIIDLPKYLKAKKNAQNPQVTEEEKEEKEAPKQEE